MFAALLFAPAALGGVAGWALWTLWALSALALFGVVLDAALSRRRLTGSLAAAALGVLALATAVQSLPLPSWLLAHLSPQTDDLFRFTLGPHHLYPAWRPLSLDPPATGVELAKSLCYLALFLTASQLCRSRSARRRLGAGVALLGALLAAVAYLHQLFGMDTLFGIASLHRAGLVSPFVNRNHLASALELGALAQLGLAVRTRDKRLAFAWGLCFLFTGSAVLLSGSRAGALSFLCGGLVFAALVWVKGGRGDARALMRHRVALGICFVAGVLCVAAFLNADFLVDEVESLQGIQETHALPQIWPTVVPLVREHWLTGVGRGAFRVAFPHYQKAFPQVSFEYPENVVLQMTSELGLVLGLGLLVLLAGAWLEIARRSDLSPAEGGLLAALFAVGLHEFADFGLEISGVAVPALLALAVVATRPASRRRIPRWLGMACLAALVPLGAWGLWQGRNSVARDRAEVEAALHRGSTLDALDALAWQSLQRHPADYAVPLTAALAAARANPPQPARALYWAGRAMYLAPISPWAHRLAAEALYLLGRPEQALLEEEQAAPSFSNDPSFVADLRRFLRTPEEFAALAPPTAEGVALAMHLTDFDPRLSLATGERVFAQVKLEVPSALLLLASRASQVGDHTRALAYAQRALRAAPDDAAAYGRVAEEERQLGENVDAEASLREGLRVHPGELWLSIALARALAAGRDFDAAHRLLAQVTTANPRERVSALETDANIWRAQGLDTRAVSTLREAAALVPDDPGRQYAMANLLVALGRTREAIAAVDRGLGIDHSANRDAMSAWRAKLGKQLEAEDRARLFKQLDRADELSKTRGEP